MLSLLHIENVAVVEKAEIIFGPGFNVLTGETGAGKSIVIDAISAVLGGRSGRDMVRTGASGATVTAVFTDVDKLDWFEDNGIDWEQELILMRKISAEGKSVCRINGMPVSVGQLRTLGERLLNIHGQHEGQMLLDEQHHLEYLDNFGGLGELLCSYESAYRSYRSASAEYDKLQMDEGEKARRVDILEFQIKELEQADLKPGQEEELKERRELLSNAGRLSDAVNDAFSALYGGESGTGAMELVAEADNQISYASSLSASFATVAGSLTELRYQMEAVVDELRELKDSLEFSPQELDELDERLALISRMGRKYGGGEKELLDYLERCKKELDDIAFSAVRAGELETKVGEAKALVEKTGKLLTKARMKAAEEMEKRIVSELGDLSMPGVRFAVDIRSKDSFDRTGMDEVSFIMSANAGEKLGKISRVASGGELARIMLALKSVLAENETISTMVFDEVDTGVSGVAAQRVGEKMSNLATKKQVICVTHLPQIAALADGHYLISKSVSGDRTYTQVGPLDMEGRKLEIARLTGGENITTLTLASASEQLEKAERYKAGRK